MAEDEAEAQERAAEEHTVLSTIRQRFCSSNEILIFDCLLEYARNELIAPNRKQFLLDQIIQLLESYPASMIDFQLVLPLDYAFVSTKSNQK